MVIEVPRDMHSCEERLNLLDSILRDYGLTIGFLQANSWDRRDMAGLYDQVSFAVLECLSWARLLGAGHNTRSE
jgi:hypothetical protein